MQRGNNFYQKMFYKIFRSTKIHVFRSNVNESKKPSFIELEMPMNLDEKFESYLVSAHSDWDQTFVSKQ